MEWAVFSGVSELGILAGSGSGLNTQIRIQNQYFQKDY